MQHVKFRDIEEFLDFLPKEEFEITSYLMQIVANTIPIYKEKLSYNVPYYYKNKSICFIWPASVLWGREKTYEGVRFGFTKGYLLRDELNYLDRGSQMQVYWKGFECVEDIDEDILKTYIYEAAEIDDKFM